MKLISEMSESEVKDLFVCPVARRLDPEGMSYGARVYELYNETELEGIFTGLQQIAEYLQAPVDQIRCLNENQDEKVDLQWQKYAIFGDR